MNQDSRGNRYAETQNVRITVIPQTYSGAPGVRICAYKGRGSSLHRGAEIPIPDREAAYEFIRAFMTAVDEL